MKDFNERQKRFKNYDAVAGYTVETLDYVDPTMGKVAQFGSDAYSIFKGVYAGDVGSVSMTSTGTPTSTTRRRATTCARHTVRTSSTSSRIIKNASDLPIV